MPIFMKYDGIDGDVTTVTPRVPPKLMEACANGTHISEPTAPDSFSFGNDSVRVLDETSPVLFDADVPADSLVSDGVAVPDLNCNPYVTTEFLEALD
jgi:hypothetical protein